MCSILKRLNFRQSRYPQLAIDINSCNQRFKAAIQRRSDILSLYIILAIFGLSLACREDMPWHILAALCSRGVSTSTSIYFEFIFFRKQMLQGANTDLF